MAQASTDRSAGGRSGTDITATARNGTYRAGEDEVGVSLAMTPAAALARHVEWLGFALGAATAEERWRRERLAKATKGNRAKRTDRLAEVVAEIEELTALLTGIRDLQAKASTAPTTAPRRRGRPPGSKNGTGKRTASAPGRTPATKARATKVPASKAPAPSRRRTTAAKAPSSATGPADPTAAAATSKPTTSTARRRRSTPATAG